MTNSIQEIWDEYNQEIGRYILKLSSDPDISADIKSAVFEKLIFKYDTIKDKSKIRSWLYTIAKNEFLDWKKLNKKFIEKPDENIKLNEKELTPVEELSHCTIHMISKLPEKYRLPLYLSDIKGLKQKDISEKLNLNYSALKSRIQRARKILKENLQDCCKIKTNESGQILDFHEGGQSSEEYCNHCFT